MRQQHIIIDGDGRLLLLRCLFYYDIELLFAVTLRLRHAFF